MILIRVGRHVGITPADWGYFRMRVTCRVAAATVCALALAAVAWAQQSVPPGEGGKLLSPAAKPLSAWPKMPPLSKPGDPPPEASAGWSAEEIEAARARCGELLKGLDLVVIPHAPVREGSECGAPAPVQLVSIGGNPQISFSPPPLLTCDMVAALHRWLQREVQPLARRHLGSPIVGIANMSSFSCRFARATGRLSEHGRVNAIDIGAFLTAEGHTAVVLADWGPVAREIAAKAIAAQDDTGKKAKTPQHTQPATSRAGVAVEFPAVIIGEPPSGSAFGLAPPSRLGGPKPADSPSSDAPDGKSAFLRAAHQAACAIFKTVLGPEANRAHRNHFHLDMSQRRSAAICE
jgi:hypothetical protein